MNETLILEIGGVYEVIAPLIGIWQDYSRGEYSLYPGDKVILQDTPPNDTYMLNLHGRPVYLWSTFFSSHNFKKL